MQNNKIRAVSIGILIGTLFCSTAVLSADSLAKRHQNVDPTAAEMVVDMAFVRPVMVATTILGTGAFIVSVPFSMLGGNLDKAAENLVYRPARHTFKRCLGCD